MTTDCTRILNLTLSLILALPLFAGCTTSASKGTYTKQNPVVESQSHLAGAELDQRARRMERAHRDLIEFHAALVTLQRRDDRAGIESFVDFIEPYLADHVDDQLSARGDAWNDELVTLDANLLFAKAEILRELDDYWGLQSVLREIRARYGDQNDLLVEYPFGEQNTVASALRSLRGMN